MSETPNGSKPELLHDSIESTYAIIILEKLILVKLSL